MYYSQPTKNAVVYVKSPVVELDHCHVTWDIRQNRAIISWQYWGKTIYIDCWVVVTHWGLDKTTTNLHTIFSKKKFLNQNVWFSIEMSLKIVPEGPIDNIPALFQIINTLIARFMGPTWGPSGADRTQVGPMLAPWTLLSGQILNSQHTCTYRIMYVNYVCTHKRVILVFIPLCAAQWVGYMLSHICVTRSQWVNVHRFAPIANTLVTQRAEVTSFNKQR